MSPFARNRTLIANRLGPAGLALTAVAVALGYYVGVQIGLRLTFPPATTSVLWPPNSILTAALLLVPVRQWWICLAAALPVHVMLELGAGMPLHLVGALFVTNCFEAALAAGGMRYLSDSPTEFNTFRRVAVFIGAAGLAAPILSSFADATVVHLFKGEPYWHVWRNRAFANALTELSVVPGIVCAVVALRRSIRPPSVLRLLEGASLAAALSCAALWVFGGQADVPGMPPTPSVLLLPLYLWAAVRFGVPGVSVLLFVTAFVASYETRIGHRPFAVLPPMDSLIAVQMYLTIMALPLMCVSGLLEERRRSATGLRERLRFEALLSTISGDFVRQGQPSAFEDGLRHVGEFLEADYVGLLQSNSPSGDLHVAWQWSRPEAASLVGLKCVEQFPWAFSRVQSGETLICDTIDALPADATIDREAFTAFGLHGVVVLPLVASGQVQGALSLVVTSSPAAEWDIAQLRLVAEVLANACARRSAELEVQGGRQKLAHMARLSSMGELTASLAHQLNQPLTGILNNAEAARRFIDSGRATIPQLRDILVDIIDDDRRAADVIRRVREMLTRSDWAPMPLDANALVRDVAMLISSDAVLRSVSVSFDFARDPLVVYGNRVDLEQVLLNVVTNAMDAVADRPVPHRVVTVQTIPDTGASSVLIIVRDRGPGLEEGSEDQIFEPFVTTKPAGMGMGLAVARSLVDNHGGSIRAANHPDGGAVVTITIPALAVRVA